MYYNSLIILVSYNSFLAAESIDKQNPPHFSLFPKRRYSRIKSRLIEFACNLCNLHESMKGSQYWLRSNLI